MQVQWSCWTGLIQQVKTRKTLVAMGPGETDCAVSDRGLDQLCLSGMDQINDYR